MFVPGLNEIPWAPGHRPLVGHLSLLRLGIPTALERVQQAEPLSRVRLGPVTVYAVNDAALAHEVLVTKADAFTKGRQGRGLRSATGSGMLTLEGAPHEERRKLVQPAFSRQRVSAFAPTVRELALDCARSWPLDTDVHVDERMIHLAGQLACRTLFDYKGAEDFHEVSRMIASLSHGIFLRGLLPAWYSVLPTPERRRYRHLIAWTRKALEAMYAQAEPTDTTRSLLTQLKLARQPNPTSAPLTHKDVIDEMATFWYASMSTTASALCWTWLVLADHPDVEAAVHQEADAAFADGTTVPENIPEALPYTSRVVAEVLRLHPPAPLLVRESRRTVELGGYTLPPGTTVALNIQAMHREPTVYPDPHTFAPDRWLPENAKAIPRHAYLPYGAGAHRCTGASLAGMGTPVAVAAIASRIRILPVTPRQPVRTMLAATSRPHKLRMTAEPRLRTTASVPAVPARAVDAATTGGAA
ncbi:cytochrome P450 [Kitasatospora sp. LaBMicrA B282]|uniref:cytochrome P450 n=1 Tax=Kitasatospora sp. LaBMicrA B282 TaxID=3420949 RepID=UPI003D0A0EB6